MNGRRHTRTMLKRNCCLIGRDGDAYPTTLVYLSLSGALVQVNTESQFKIGDLCDFMLSLKTAEHPVNRSCEIVRLDSKIIGVTFI